MGGDLLSVFLSSVIPQLPSAGQFHFLRLPMTPAAWKQGWRHPRSLTSQRQRSKSLPSPVYMGRREETDWLVWLMCPTPWTKTLWPGEEFSHWPGLDQR